MEIPNNIENAVESSPMVAQSAFGAVHHSVSPNCDIAIKQRRLQQLGDEADVQTEYDLLLRAQCDHVVRALDFRIQPPNAYVIMQYMHGGSLHEHVRDNPLTDNHTKMFAFQLLSAVEFIHGVGIIHHDIKPRNILLDEQRRVLKLADFALATRQEELAAQDPFRGTIRYMAPEVAKGDFQGPKIDIWSVGATMIQMRTGRSPFHHLDHPMQIIFHLGNNQLTHELNDYSDSLDHLIARLMTIEPAERPDATEALILLREILGPSRLSKLALDKALVSPFTEQEAIPLVFRHLLTLDNETLPKLIESLKSQYPSIESESNQRVTECLDESLMLLKEVMEAPTREDKVSRCDKAIDCLKIEDIQNLKQETKLSVIRWLHCIHCVRSRVAQMNHQ